MVVNVAFEYIGTMEYKKFGVPVVAVLKHNLPVLSPKHNGLVTDGVGMTSKVGFTKFFKPVFVQPLASVTVIVKVVPKPGKTRFFHLVGAATDGE